MRDYPVINTEATGKRIKELCRHNNISVNDVKEFMGFENPQAIYKWQRGETLPNIDNFFALSRLLNVPIDSIIISEDDSRGSSSEFIHLHK
ncbi:MAG: helix-turn-helix transcriptional regulator [Lachnospiraceae bacterium]|nr:helix-turn-helix transcriptional regulator [Lachnospiraceae bacterium]